MIVLQAIQRQEAITFVLHRLVNSCSLHDFRQPAASPTSSADAPVFPWQTHSFAILWSVELAPSVAGAHESDDELLLLIFLKLCHGELLWLLILHANIYSVSILINDRYWRVLTAIMKAFGCDHIPQSIVGRLRIE